MDLDKPALAPPPGIQSNFDNPPNGNVEAHIGIAICIFIVFVGGSLRAYSKIVCMKQVRLEDYIGLIALAPYIAFIYGVYNPMGTVGIYVHQWDVRASQAPAALYIVYVNTSLFQATMATIKSAILLEWMHVFVPHGTRTKFWWTCQIIMWVNILYYISIVTASALSCFPHEKIWHPTMPGRCFNTKVLFVSNATLNLVSDIIILALPQGIIWKLNMSTQKKIGVSLVFAIGVIATLVGGARLARAVIYYLSNDNIYNVSAVFLWCTAELSTSFLVFCLPAIPKVFSSDNWITQLASRLHSRLSFLKTRITTTSGTNPKASTWMSSGFSGGSISESGWDQRPHLAYEQHGFVSYYADPDNPNAIKSYVHYDSNPRPPGPYIQAPWPSVPSIVTARHNPSTSWYEAGP